MDSKRSRQPQMPSRQVVVQYRRLTRGGAASDNAGMDGQVFDQIVIGAGGMGSAAIYELARRGQRVLGLKQFSIPHELGSSAGSTRIFRFAYFEHPSYVPLMRLSLARWL